MEQGKDLKKVTFMGEDSDDGVEREDVRILELVKDTEGNARWVLANETRGYEVVLVCAYLKNACMTLEKVRTGKMALQEGSEVLRVVRIGIYNGRQRARVKKRDNRGRAVFGNKNVMGQ